MAGNNSYQYKYNGKELQETGMLDYGWRQYMPELGRWNGMDQLAEKYNSVSPFAYVGNNPINRFDPDGRLTKAQTDYIWNNSGQGVTSWSFNTDGSPKMNSYNPMDDSDIQKLLSSFYGAASGQGPSTIAYFTGTPSQTSYLIGQNLYGEGNFGTGHLLTVRNEMNPEIDWSKTASNSLWWINTMIGAASTGNLPRTGFFKYSELWHATKTRGVSFAWEGRWSNPGAKFWRGQQIKPFEGARGLGDKFTKAGGVLLAADIAMSGQVRPSHWINGAMLAASTTGVGSIVAGAWFITDMGVGAINYMGGNGFTTLSDVIDQSNWGQNHTVEMYNGVY